MRFELLTSAATGGERFRAVPEAGAPSGGRSFGRSAMGVAEKFCVDGGEALFEGGQGGADKFMFVLRRCFRPARFPSVRFPGRNAAAFLSD